MASQKALYEEASNQKTLDETNLILEKHEERLIDRETINLANPPEFAASVLSVYLAIAAGALIVFGILHKRVQSHMTTELLSHLNRVPCMHCHFFSTNPYLRCALNPVTVLTQEATDCSDYRRRNSKLH
ncbi:hypothetical protein IQ230_24880 [Gloeocapsopsis crepidinum LEGE 06123]|uniref:Uncharacterized protein n=1 Tax=Gloeocapsopsis crepidinum LEGE 06123 TaxID=588587 RepID=A0ABR9UYZ9_9CHRO|nr:hypothetical protein [Gloeocapsopsis crepidinum LEGE 06123]